MQGRNERLQPDTATTAAASESDTTPYVDGLVVGPLAAALDAGIFSRVKSSEAIPASREEHAREGVGVLRPRTLGEELRQLLARLQYSSYAPVLQAHRLQPGRQP